jgi:putative tricarboxylic transport membrane protein
MIDTAALSDALALLATSFRPWAYVLPGLLIGLFFGAVPGLSISIAMALFLPFTFYLDFLSAMLFLTAIFTGGNFAGAIPSILINVPGAPTAVATTFDGYPMTRAGRYSEALGLALGASTLGTAAGYVVLFVLIDPLAWVVLRLGPTEMLLVALWGLTLIAVLRGRHYGRGLIAGLAGLMLGTVGMSSRGDMRGTFDSFYLLDGIPVVPAILGLFAASELLNLSRSDFIVAEARNRTIRLRPILAGIRGAVAHPAILLRGSVIGVLVGALPGVGSSVANLISYAETKRRAPDGDRFGTGDPRGVIAAESANSSSEGGAMATLMALGIPGGGATAIMLSAFALHGITGGPKFINDQKDVVYAVVLANLVQAVLLLVVGLGFVFLATTIVRVRVRFLIPGVLAVCTAGAYALTGNMIGPVTLLGFGLLGWVLRRYDYPVAGVAVGMLLGSIADAQLLRSWQIIGGDLSYLLTRPMTLILLGLIVASLCWPLVKTRLARRNA